MTHALMEEWALRYIRLGWAVFPLWPHDARGAPSAEYPEGELIGKRPLGVLVPRGSKDASLNETQVRIWWGHRPDANVALATGRVFFAADIDIKSGGEETWDNLCAQHGPTPETIEQTTGTGGRHLLFLMPADFVVKNSQCKLGPGLDIRGVGGYIVAAPSIHPETKRAYDWDGLKEIEEQTIAPAPAWLIRLLRDSERRPGGAAPPVQVPDKIREGGRNDTLFRIASQFRRNGLSEEEILAALREMNRARCEPPLSEGELQIIARSAASYKPDGRANVFRLRPPAAPGAETESGVGDPGELPLTAADVLATIDHIIETNAITAAFAPELMRHIARLRPHEIALIKAKLGSLRQSLFGAGFSIGRARSTARHAHRFRAARRRGGFARGSGSAAIYAHRFRQRRKNVGAVR